MGQDQPRDEASHARVIAEFDARAPTYETTYRLAGWYRAQSELVLRALQETPQDIVLDVGCGTGWLLRRLGRFCPGARGIGVDLSARMIEVARSRAAAEGVTGVVFRQGDWEEDETARAVPGLLAGAITSVVCVSAFHYFAQPERALRRIHDCLAPGGRLLIVERAKNASPLTHLWDGLHRHLIRDNVRFYGMEEIVRLAGAAGFRDARTLADVRRYFWQGKMYTRLVLLGGTRDGA